MVDYTKIPPYLWLTPLTLYTVRVEKSQSDRAGLSSEANKKEKTWQNEDLNSAPPPGGKST